MSQGRVISRTRESITTAGARSGRLIPAGAVLLSFKLSIGKVAINLIPLFTNEAIAALTPRVEGELHPAYLLRALESLSLRQQANRAVMGATLNRSQLEQIRLPLPDLGEQKRIAAILDRADALRINQRLVLDHLDALTQSIFHDMFGDPARYPEHARFGEMITLTTGKSIIGTESRNGGPRVLKISAVTSGVFRPSESKPLPEGYAPPSTHFVHEGDLLMSRANTTELVGAVAFVESDPGDIALPDKIWKFTWSDPRSVPEYYAALLRHPTIRRRLSALASGSGGSMKNISKAKLNEMPLPAVDPEEQGVFLERARRVSAARRTTVSKIAEADELFASLQSRAFRGEL